MTQLKNKIVNIETYNLSSQIEQLSRDPKKLEIGVELQGFKKRMPLKLKHHFQRHLSHLFNPFYLKDTKFVSLIFH